MIGTLTHRIQMICGDELSMLRRRMYALGWQDFHEGAVDVAATAMARKPSCVNQGVSVDVVCFALGPSAEAAAFMISVAMHVHPQRSPGAVYWEEADAWAQAVAGHGWFSVEPRGSRENASGRVFHYALIGEARTPSSPRRRGWQKLHLPDLHRRSCNPGPSIDSF
ncbi:hypothetical protein [Pseudarthrobacter sulfonivorans]|uniref:hypothetical protein n=1 Tax=Pseudarthrobacter sulfonivorans TaxID=121292 RepID=UPI0028644A1E|nr:hypothetical protein [Pseudarthrobacter sulfonivorans]MDR6417079.1 hypothetical protein [Pseudarthrobacter sulfonivorans]